MSTYTLNNVKKRIRKRLSDLRENEEQMKREIETLQDSLEQFHRWVQSTKKDMSQSQLKEMAEELGLNIRVQFPFISLAKYFIVQQIDRQIITTKHRIQETTHRIRNLDNERENVYRCPQCNGLAYETKTHYVREDSRVIPITTSKDCPICKGKGKIDLNAG